MLKRLELNHTCRPLECVSFWQRESYLDLNAPYQRGDVWGVKRRRNLIRSFLLGVPVPSIVINDHMKAEWPDDDFRVVVIDGKQRITTILMFLDDEFTVPAEWFGLDGGEVSYGTLPIREQRKFHNVGIQFTEGSLKTIADEIAVFNLVNFGGLAQGESDGD